MSLRRVLAVVLSLVATAFTGIQQANAQLFSTGPWSGLHVGVHGGYGMSSSADPSLGGMIAGLHAGYSLQLGSAVLGIEGDYTWSNADGSAAIPGLTVKTEIDRMWSVRGRLGWLVTPSVLLYGTAGFGALDVAATATVSGFALTGNARYDGLVYGGGAELLLTRSLMLRAEVLRFDVDGSGPASGDKASANQIRAAISYKF